MKDNYTYPAIIDYSEEGFVNIEFPDFPGTFSCVEKDGDFIKEAQDVLALSIQDLLDRKDNLPNENVMPVVESDKQIVFINIWLPYHKRKIKEVYIKKTLTIPAWLDSLAKESQINFSAVLVEGLKEKLAISH